MDKAAEDIIALLLSENAEERSEALLYAGDLLRAKQDQHLKQAVSDMLQHEQDPNRASELIWVLGKSGDARFIENYRDCLRKFVADMRTASAGIHQALIALDNCGEPVFEHDTRGRSSQSILNIEKNLRQAKAYLASQEVGSS